jgi:hypothetical protein
MRRKEPPGRWPPLSLVFRHVLWLLCWLCIGGEVVNFDDGFEALNQYKAAHGDLLVPQSMVVTAASGAEVKLGRWVQRMRQLHKNTYITPKARKGFGKV